MAYTAFLFTPKPETEEKLRQITGSMLALCPLFENMHETHLSEFVDMLLTYTDVGADFANIWARLSSRMRELPCA